MTNAPAERTWIDRYWTSSDGLKLHYRDYDGPEDALPVLCLHGLTRNARDFADVAEHLHGRHRVIVPELRGRGDSEYARDASTYTPLTYLADLAALFDELAWQRFVAIGTSLGGILTMLYALHRATTGQGPEIAGAVLNDIGPEIDANGLERIRSYVGHGRSFPTWMHAARALMETSGDSFPDYDIEQWIGMAKRIMVVGQNGRITYDYDMALAEPFNQPGGEAGVDLWPAFEAMHDSPLTILRGQLSDILSRATLDEMLGRHPGALGVEVLRVGHAPMLDEDESLAAIDSLLSRSS
ncbi:MAG: alpha/beta fold hydrolase [Sphingomonadaceae bacterium]